MGPLENPLLGLPPDALDMELMLLTSPERHLLLLYYAEEDGISEAAHAPLPVLIILR